MSAAKSHARSVAILGPGNIGGTLAHLLAPHGHRILLSFFRDRGKAEQVAANAGHGVSLALPSEVGAAEVLILSVPWTAIDDALASAGPLAGRVLIDATNPYGASPPVDRLSSTLVARRAPGAHVAKAFNSLNFRLLEKQGGGKAEPRAVMPFGANHEGARVAVKQLIHDAGYEPLDLGTLEDTHPQEPGQPLYNKVLSRAQALTLLGRTDAP